MSGSFFKPNLRLNITHWKRHSPHHFVNLFPLSGTASLWNKDLIWLVHNCIFSTLNNGGHPINICWKNGLVNNFWFSDLRKWVDSIYSFAEIGNTGRVCGKITFCCVVPPDLLLSYCFISQVNNLWSKRWIMSQCYSLVHLNVSPKYSALASLPFSEILL